MKKTIFPNDKGINYISCLITTRNYCPLGEGWYTNHFTVEVNVKETLADYLYIEQMIKERVDGKELIIEDAVAEMYGIFKEAGFDEVTVLTEVDDASHFAVKVVKQ